MVPVCIFMRPMALPWQIEDKVVTTSRAKGSLTFSADFQLIAAMNPCPCNYHGDSQKPCTCAPAALTKYQKHIYSLLLDRIDIYITFLPLHKQNLICPAGYISGIRV